MNKKEKIKSKIYFDHYTVHHYSDGTFRFESYAPYFEDLFECIKWGRAYQEAEQQIAEGQKKIAKLQEETIELLEAIVLQANHVLRLRLASRLLA
jgi:hypothetical protein